MEIIDDPLNWMERRRSQNVVTQFHVPSLILIFAMIGATVLVHSHRRQLIQLLTSFKKVAPPLYLICTMASSLVVWKAYRQNQQFYPTCLCLIKSPFAMTLYRVQSCVCVFYLATLLCKLFLRTLSDTELDSFVQSLCHAFPEMILIYLLVPGVVENTPLVLFALFVCLKSFHWLVQKRVDIMRRSVWFRWLTHFRFFLLCLLLVAIDCTLIAYTFMPNVTRVNLLRMVVCFDCSIMLTVVLCTAMKHLLQVIEAFFGWEGHRSTLFLICADLVSCFIKLLLYLWFMSIMAHQGPPPLFASQASLLALRDLIVGLYNLRCSWLAIRNLNTTYPDVAPHELDDADVCVICCESMIVNAKKLPCGHIFHTNCLYDWYLRHPSCPVCRFNVIGSTTIAANEQQIEAAEAEIMTAELSSLQESTTPDSPPAVQPMFLYLGMPYTVMQSISNDLSNLSLAELNALEKILRDNIEQRLEVLRQINEYSKTAYYLMQIYRIVELRSRYRRRR